MTPGENEFDTPALGQGEIKEKINKWDYIKIKSFCMAKENSIKMKREPTVWENISVNDTSDKDFFSQNIKRTYQENKQPN